MKKNLIIGTAQFSESYGLNKKFFFSNYYLSKIKKLLKKKGLNSFDTAFFYANSYKKLKKIISEKPKVYTKIKIKDFKNFEEVQINIEYQLKLLNIKKFECIFIHDFEYKDRKIHKSILELENLLIDKNYTKKFGYSIYEEETLNFLYNSQDLSIIQLPINIMNRTFNDISSSIYKSKNVEFIARSIFLQGVLIDKKNEIYKRKSNTLNKYFDWLNLNNISPVEACINYVNSLEFISSFIVGFNSFNQLLEITETSLKKIDLPSYFNSNDKMFIDPRYW